jgi:biotin carboxylase
MMNAEKKFEGKKFLLLGTNAATCDMVNYARSQGAHVIVTDNLLPQKSAAKQIADETWMVSTADVDTLEQLAIKNQITGISAGVSEFNLEKALTLCERLGLPFYCTREQWETCSNKQLFKKLCRDNGVPVAREYRVESNCQSVNLRQIKYPVIVKPVDRSAGIGIRICRNETELPPAYARAASLSKTNQAIIEELMEGNEFSAGYTIKGGEFSLTYVVDRYLAEEPGETISLLQAAILPSKYTERYIKELNPKVIKMFQNIGLTYGFIFVQGIVNKDGFHLVEANYRSSGAALYRIISRIKGINYMEMLVDYALTGKMEGYDLSLDNHKFNGYGCNLELMSKGGRVGKILGLEDILKKKTLIAVEKRYNVGDYIDNSGTARQTHLQFLLVEESVQGLKDSIRQIQDTVKVLDDKGNNMLSALFNTDRI